MFQGMISLSHVSSDQLNQLSMLSGKEKERRHRLLISEMPEAVLLPKIRDVLRDPYTGPDNVKKILRMNKTSELKEKDVRSPVGLLLSFSLSLSYIQSLIIIFFVPCCDILPISLALTCTQTRAYCIPQHKESVLMQCKTAMFDSSIPTSPQKLNAQSASNLVCVCVCVRVCVCVVVCL